MLECMKTPKMRLAKENRIRKRREYLRVQRYGVRSSGRFLVVIAQQDRGNTSGKVGITVPKKVGAAHVRNKIKRRLRHALRTNQGLFFGKNLVVVAKDSSNAADFGQLSTDLIDACRRLKASRPTYAPSQRA